MYVFLLPLHLNSWVVAVTDIFKILSVTVQLQFLTGRITVCLTAVSRDCLIYSLLENKTCVYWLSRLKYLINMIINIVHFSWLFVFVFFFFGEFVLEQNELRLNGGWGWADSAAVLLVTLMSNLENKANDFSGRYSC